MLGFLADVSRLTWNEIGNQNTGGRNRRRKHHDQPVSGLCKEALDGLAVLRLDEVFGDEIYRFRLSGTHRRLWGFVEDGVFYVLWWDPDPGCIRRSPADVSRSPAPVTAAGPG